MIVMHGRSYSLEIHHNYCQLRADTIFTPPSLETKLIWTGLISSISLLHPEEPEPESHPTAPENYPEDHPTESKPSAPAKSKPTARAKSKPSTPAKSKPTASAKSKPTAPATSEPTKNTEARSPLIFCVLES